MTEAPPPVTVVTGASAGIGRALCARLVADGHRVLGVSRRPCPVDGVVTIPADLGAADGVAACLPALCEAIGQAGTLHLVHNAGVMPEDSVDAFDPVVSERTMRVNVVAPAALTAGLRDRLGRGSGVVVVGSTLSEQGVPGRLSYVMSKHAALGLVRGLAQDLFGTGVHTVCVAPGFTDSAMLRDVLDATPGLEDAAKAMTSYGRLLDPAEVADVIAYALRTPALNGSVVHANLGQRQR